METETKKVNAISIAVLGTLAFLFAFCMPVPDSAFSSIRMGEFFLKKGILPPPYQLSFLPVNSSWFNYSWLFDIFSSALYRLGEEWALKTIAGILTALSVFLLYKSAPSTEKIILRFAVTLFFLMVMNHAFEFKPLLLTIFLFCLQIYMLQKTSRKILFFLLYSLWANCDLGFICGVVYLIFYIFSAEHLTPKVRTKILLSALGGAIFSYNIYQILSNSHSLKLFFEPTPDFHLNINRFQALWALAGLASASLAKKVKGARVSQHANALLSIFALSLLAGRYLPLAVIASYPLLLEGLREFLRAVKLEENKPFNFGVTLLAICAFIFAIPREEKNAQKSLLQFITTHSFFGEVSAPLEIGGKVAHLTHKRACMESVFGLYDTQSAITYRTIYFPWGDEWEKAIIALKIGGIIVKRKENPYYAIAQKKGWALVFQNESYALFVKEDGMNISLIAKWGKIAPDTEPKLSEEERIANAQRWLDAGNLYRTKWELLKLLQENPKNKLASEKLAQVENLIQRAHEKR